MNLMTSFMQSGWSRWIFVSLFLTFGVGILFARNYKPVNEVLQRILDSFKRYSEHYANERIYLHLDKKLYKPGETVWFSGYLRNETDLKPSAKSDILHVDLLDPKGGVVKSLTIIAKDGAANGEFDISEDMAGGLYKVRAYTVWQKNYLKEEELYAQEIQVQKVVLPRLKMKMDFERKAYGPGDEAEAKLEFNSLKNEPLRNREVTFQVKLDGVLKDTRKAQTDYEGKLNFKYKLPADLATADGLITALISHEGQTESISRTIPIVLNKIDFAFYPEGGEMVAGLESRVAFAATNEFGKPADVSGEVWDNSGKKVAEFSSFHQGMGAFPLKPEAGKTYKVKLTAPSKQEFDLPRALPRGYALKVNESRNSGLNVDVLTTENEELHLVGQIRGKEVFSKSVIAKSGKNPVVIPTTDFPMGVMQITLFDGKGIPRAERLAFVNYDKKLKFEIITDKKQYQPREEVKMTVRITDERGMPMPATFSLAVVDDNLLSFADDKTGHILSQMLLEQDLNGKVEEPKFYFDPKEKKGYAALDYLMLTRGWRRFKWEEVLKNNPLPAFANAGERAVIGGTVYLPDGKPAAGVDVTFTSTSAATQKLKTDANGRYEYKPAALQNYISITAQKDKLTGYSNAYMFGSQYNIYLYDRSRYEIESAAAGGRVMRKNAMAPQAVPAPAGNAVPEVMAEAPDNVPMDKAMAKDDAVEMKRVEVKEKNIEELPIAKLEEQKPEAEENLRAVMIQEKIVMAEPVMDEDWAGDEPFEGAPMPKKPPMPQYHVAREFAVPVYPKGEKVEMRTDFRSTIYWKGGVTTDRKGEATVTFVNSDEVTSFRAIAEGISVDGLVGFGETTYFTLLPFSMDVKAPAQVSMGDRVQIPLTLKNNTNEDLKGALTVKSPAAWKAASTNPTEISLPAQSAKTTYLVFDVQNQPGKGDLEVSFASPTASDAFRQTVETGAKGFPVQVNLSGSKMETQYIIPVENLVTGTLTGTLTVYPSPLSEMISGLESMLREPYGCFEQTSSTAYPNIMVMQYLKESDYKDKAILARANDLLDKGYNRLVTFETPEKGYEWFGGAPGHEALTAYGLLEFKDMESVYGKVDQTMVKRTQDWLLARKDGKGGFKRNERALDSFGRASDEITNAYILYAMTESGYLDLPKEADAAYNVAMKEGDPYQMALVANALYLMKDARADEVMKKLLKAQETDGSWNGKKHSVTCSQGLGLKVETTSLAILACLKMKDPDKVAMTKGVQALVASKTGWNGGYGSTQSTILALKAITAFTKFSKRTAEAGTVVLHVDGKEVAKKSFEAGHQGPIVIDGLDKYLKAGKNNLVVEFKGLKEALPHSLSVSWSTTLPTPSTRCKVGLETSMSAANVKVGETVRLTATLTNKTKDGLPMTMAILGLPGGLSAQPFQLKELQEKKVFDFYEIIGNRLAIYYRQMTPNEKRTVNLDLKAEIPGSYESPASTAYLYYTAEDRDWKIAQKVNVTAQ